MIEIRCAQCGSLLAKTEVFSKVEIKCGHCHDVNRFILGTLFEDQRHMKELDFERAERKRIKRKERRFEL
jgi:phage FluMu protein Com